MNEKLPQKQTPFQINYDDAGTIATIKQTVAVGATDLELALFLQVCKSTGLNPFNRELWCIKAGNRVQIMVGLSGYLKIANQHPQFDGMEIELLKDSKGIIEGAQCKVYRKDRKYPSTGIALLREYRKSTPIWDQMTSVMISKCAKCIAIREAFPIETAGTYAEEEMPPEYSSANIQAQTRVTTKTRLPKVIVRTSPPDDFDVPDFVAEPFESVDEVQDIEPPRIYAYDLEGVTQEKRQAAIMWATAQGARKDRDSGFYLSAQPLGRLSAYETKPPLSA